MCKLFYRKLRDVVVEIWLSGDPDLWEPKFGSDLGTKILFGETQHVGFVAQEWELEFDERHLCAIVILFLAAGGVGNRSDAEPNTTPPSSLLIVERSLESISTCSFDHRIRTI